MDKKVNLHAGVAHPQCTQNMSQTGNINGNGMLEFTCVRVCVCVCV